MSVEDVNTQRQIATAYINRFVIIIHINEVNQIKMRRNYAKEGTKTEKFYSSTVNGEQMREMGKNT